MRIPKLLIKLSRKDNGTLTDRVLKLNEEAGELAEAAIILSGRKNPKKDKPFLEDQHDHVIEEAVDVLIMSMDILSHMDASNSQINKCIQNKLKKWERNRKK